MIKFNKLKKVMASIALGLSLIAVPMTSMPIMASAESASEIVNYIKDHYENGLTGATTNGLIHIPTGGNNNTCGDQAAIGFSSPYCVHQAAQDWVTTDKANRQQTGDQNEKIDKVHDELKNINMNLDMTPDTGRAIDAFSGFFPALRFILGGAVVLITSGMTLLCACDILYIVFPVFRGKCEDMKQSGKGVARGRSEKAGETRLKFISDEAEFAVTSAETGTTGQNALAIYFKKRIIAYIILAVVIFILLTGNITIITDIAVKAVEGLLRLIQTMGGN